LERYEESLTAFERALALDERVVGAWVGKATSLGKLGRPNDALAASDRALSIDPNDTYALATKGEALFDLGRLDEALAVCERAISLDPGSADAQRAKAAILRAQAQKAEHSAVMLLRLECQQNVKALLDYWAKVSADGVHIPGVGILVGVGMSFQEIEYDKRQCLAREPMPVWGRQVWDSHASIVAQALNDPALISRVYTLYADLATFIARRKELREAFDTPEGEQLAKDYSRWMQAKQAGQGSIDYREEQGTDMKLGAFNEKTRSLWAECQAISQRALQYRDSNVIPEG
jgi:tetratricopeptide (TPR) repeat protein